MLESFIELCELSEPIADTGLRLPIEPAVERRPPAAADPRACARIDV
jgi:hypothetical protein